MSSPSPVYAFGPFVLDPASRLLLRAGDPVPVTPKAFDVLCVLAEGAGRTVSKDVLLQTVWPDTVVDESNLAYQMSTLRKILGSERYIVTVPGQGYQLVTPVHFATRDETEIVSESQPQRAQPWRVLVPVATALAVIVAIAAAFWSFWSFRTKPKTPAVPAQIRSIAVLPFKPIVVARRDEALEMGMADALITRIGSIHNVTVRPLTSVRRYGGVTQDPIAAGREQGVDAVLDGSIQSNGDRIRVTARLLRVTDAVLLWSGEFDQRFSEIFAVQDSISSRLVEELSWNLTADERKRMRRRDTENAEAYRAYSIASLHRERMQSGEIDQAIANFKRAITLDPGYAAPYSALADCYLMMPVSSDRPTRANYTLAKEFAERAIALDPESDGGTRVLAGLKFWHDWDWPAAEKEFRRAIELNPNSSIGHVRYAHLLSNIGRHEDAMREVREGTRLDPVSPMVNTMAGLFSVQAGNVDAGIRQLQHVREVDPGFWIARITLGWAYESQGRFDEAMIELHAARERSGDSLEPLAMIGYVHGIRGETAEARKILDELLAMTRRRYVPATKIARVYAGMGDRDNAFRWLEKACDERDLWLVYLKVDPRWRKLAGDPRFESIRKCVNLPE